MKLTLWLCIVLALGVNKAFSQFPSLPAPSLPASLPEPPIDAEKITAFKDFTVRFGRAYVNNPTELLKRRDIFFAVYDEVKKHNEDFAKGLETFTKAINLFSDMTPEERKVYRRTKVPEGFKPIPEGTPIPHSIGRRKRAAGMSVDWRNKGYVSPVLDQGPCGSCWAFSTVSVLEGQVFKKTGTLPKLSQQNLIDCSTANGNEGCDGGWIPSGFDYIKDNGGINTNDTYPYSGAGGTCNYNKDSVGAKISGYTITPASDDDLRNALATVGPISVVVSANDMMEYSKGIYRNPSCPNAFDVVDHGMLLVGFNNNTKPSYWIIKNSWGTEWGENGYVRMTMDTKNHCGISANGGFYPNVV